MSSFFFNLLVLLLSCTGLAQNFPYIWTDLERPDTNGIWIQPAQGKNAQPVWGHVKGLRVGLAPMPGPRGLLRIYTPYLGHEEGKMMNFIAFEPIVKGESKRGFSELEFSKLDKARGKRFWSSNDSLCKDPASEVRPASGKVSVINGLETLTVYIFSETFENGARVYVRMRFFENRPYEVELTTNKCELSDSLDHFILTATMGNFSRLRTLYLKGKTKSSLELWPDYRDIYFAPHDYTPAGEMISDDKGGVYFIAAPNESNLQAVNYSPDTREHWKYYGGKATQYWYCPDPGDDLNGLVNGRYFYWASKSPIPGGIAYENFEMKDKFRNGQRFVFGITPEPPKKFIMKITKEK